VVYSFDLAEIEPLELQGRWDEAAKRLVEALRAVERAGAEVALICSNTTHTLAERAERHITIPLLHIADAIGARVAARGMKRVGLLGTRFTMEGDVYTRRLAERHAIEVLLPDEGERHMIHDAIYQELCAGVFKPSMRGRFRDVMLRLAENGAEGIILGCTEIPLLVSQEDSDVPLFDTLRIHVEAAAAYALAP
jgi:aspartate racemase